MTPISLHNTLSGKKEKFEPLVTGRVGMYQCGPTVYDTAHIGNLRTFVFDDIVRRVFEYSGFAVTQVMNITDVDDKTIRRSGEEGVSLAELTSKYEALFLADIDTLNIRRPHHILSARAHVPDMISMISTLLERDVAYVAKDGVYLSIDKVKNYGALAKLKINATTDTDAAANAKAHERIANDEYDKENPRDFAVWKFSEDQAVKKDAEEISWDAPFGRGRPGWHIECSAMAVKALGDTIDIHTGGSDLIFPHHTNEIAQSEAATGKPFVHYWLHGGFMNVNDEKMAKSKGNFLKLSDLVENAIAPIAFRYWLLTSHYRSQVNFSLDAVQAAQTALFKLCEEIIVWPDGGTISKKYQADFKKNIADDFNMPQAVATLWKMVKDSNTTDADKKTTVLDFDRVLGLRLSEISAIPSELDKGKTTTEIPPEIIALADAREVARVAKDWAQADALRAEIESRGYALKDTDKGPQIIEN